MCVGPWESAAFFNLPVASEEMRERRLIHLDSFENFGLLRIWDHKRGGEGMLMVLAEELLKTSN